MREGCGPGIDVVTVEELPEYLNQHWPAIREQLLSGTYMPQMPQVGRNLSRTEVRKLGIATVLEPVYQTGGAAGLAEAVKRAAIAMFGNADDCNIYVRSERAARDKYRVFVYIFSS